jgi:hypothetical protein
MQGGHAAPRRIRLQGAFPAAGKANIMQGRARHQLGHGSDKK